MGIDPVEDDDPLETKPLGERLPPGRHPPAPPGISQGKPREPDPGETPWESLIRQGKDRGFVTHTEIERVIKASTLLIQSIQKRKPIPEPWSLLGRSAEMEPVWELFRRMGIEVRGIPRETLEQGG